MSDAGVEVLVTSMVGELEAGPGPSPVGSNEIVVEAFQEYGVSAGHQSNTDL